MLQCGPADGAKNISMPIHHWLRAASKDVNSQELLAFLAQAARGQSSNRETQVLAVGRESIMESRVYKNDKEIQGDKGGALTMSPIGSKKQFMYWFYATYIQKHSTAINSFKRASKSSIYKTFH